MEKWKVNYTPHFSTPPTATGKSTSPLRYTNYLLGTFHRSRQSRHLKIQNGEIQHGEIAMKDRERTIIQNDRVTVFSQNLSTDSRANNLVVYAQNPTFVNLHTQAMDRHLLKANRIAIDQSVRHM